ncbi:MAG: hypothetical protein LUO93_06235, partial [Methanomicrobiales archaeon]|nr:hypothetical protein [Methanomicrobiales archaeon]
MDEIEVRKGQPYNPCAKVERGLTQDLDTVSLMEYESVKAVTNMMYHLFEQAAKHCDVTNRTEFTNFDSEHYV